MLERKHMTSKYSKVRIIALTAAVVCMSTVYASAATYQFGDKGKDITTIQQKLIKHGYNATDKSGVYGKETKWAVRLFQEDNGLQVDGIVGPTTYKALMGAMSSDAKASKKSRETNKSKTSKSSKSKPKAKKASSEFSITKYAPVSGDVKRILQEADKYRGVPYVFGGATPSGFDCSGYIRYVFAKQGMEMPRMADEQYRMGKAVSQSNLQPGDLVFFETYEPGPSHSGIYIGDGKFISATSSSGVAVADMTSGYWGDRYLGAKRVM